MKKTRKSTFFIVAVFIFVFTYLSFFGLSDYFGDNKIVYVKGVSDIRWGIDIQGGVEAVFQPDIDGTKVTGDDMEKAQEIIKIRLNNNNITDAEVYEDKENHQVIVRFPWQNNTDDFDPQKAVEELGQMAVLEFRKGDSNEKGELILSGNDVKSATAANIQNDSGSNEWVVSLELNKSGKSKFGTATTELSKNNGTITIWMDETPISTANVNEPILNGQAQISGGFTAETAEDLAEQINAGSLPFALTADESKLQIVSPTLGKQSLETMLIAGIIAFVLVVIIMISLYRLPGFVASIALLCQIAFIFAFISGFFTAFDSFTLTIPGIAGIILSIGMGVDANVISSERIREEIRGGKTVDGAIKLGYDKAVSSIIDGNITVVIVAVILMGAFGSPTSLWAKILSPLMFMFNSSITGSIYSFGYTLLIGAIANLFIGVVLTKLMLKSLARFKCFKKPWLYGGVKNAK
jgi:protein-export SecD/SecF family membrane protein